MSERYYNSTKSKLEKYGPGDSHESAVARVVAVLLSQGWKVDLTAGVEMKNYSKFYVGEDNKPKPEHYIHQWDIKARKKTEFDIYVELIVEVDGKRHEKKQQQFNDEDARKVAEFFFWLKGLKSRNIALGDFIFLRMPIENTNSEQDIFSFLKEKLKGLF